MAEPTPILEAECHGAGRGPELQRVVWRGAVPVAFEYFNPDDEYVPANLRHLRLVGVQAFAYAIEEVHGRTKWVPDSHAAVLNLGISSWFASLNPRHLAGCSHYQVVFYDDVFDLICREITAGLGAFADDSG
jgi:hypothetical protein